MPCTVHDYHHRSSLHIALQTQDQVLHHRSAQPGTSLCSSSPDYRLERRYPIPNSSVSCHTTGVLSRADSDSGWKPSSLYEDRDQTHFGMNDCLLNLFAQRQNILDPLSSLRPCDLLAEQPFEKEEHDSPLSALLQVRSWVYEAVAKVTRETDRGCTMRDLIVDFQPIVLRG